MGAAEETWMSRNLGLPARPLELSHLPPTGLLGLRKQQVALWSLQKIPRATSLWGEKDVIQSHLIINAEPIGKKGASLHFDKRQSVHP